MLVEHLLSVLTLVPLLGAAIICLMPSGDRPVHRLIAIVFAVGAFLLGTACLMEFDFSNGGMQFFDEYRWVSALNISYSLGIDGLNVFLICVVALIFLLSIFAANGFRYNKTGSASFSEAGYQVSGTKGYFALILLLQSAVFGMCLSQDLFLFFTFFLMAAVPVYFLIGVWGAKDRERAATEYVAYQLLGSVFILLGMLLLYYSSNPHTFDLKTLAETKFSEMRVSVLGQEWNLERVAYILMFIGFAVRVALVPVHVWLPKVLSEAPPAVAMVLASAVPAAAIYGFVRINYGLFTDGTIWFKDALAIIAVVTIIYSAFCALGQRDLRRLLAYSSIGQFGFVFFGLTVLSSNGLHGAMLALICSVLINALMSYLVSIVGSRVGHFSFNAEGDKPNLGGLVLQSPWFSSIFALTIFAAIGFPGIGLFGPRTLIFLGAFKEQELLTLFGLFGVLLTAGFLMGAYRKIFLGRPGTDSERVYDLNLTEKTIVLPIVALILFIGISPGYLIRVSESTVTKMVSAFKGEVNTDVQH